MPLTTEEIEERFKHHPPLNEAEIKVHETIRSICQEAALNLMVALPDKVINTREFAQTLSDLENAMYHANAAYARHK